MSYDPSSYIWLGHEAIDEDTIMSKSWAEGVQENDLEDVSKDILVSKEFSEFRLIRVFYSEYGDCRYALMLKPYYFYNYCSGQHEVHDEFRDGLTFCDGCKTHQRFIDAHKALDLNPVGDFRLRVSLYVS